MNNETPITVGMESCCLTCKWGKVLKIRTQPHPVQVWEAQKANPAFEEPPIVYFMESYCTHLALTGKEGAARKTGVVVSCELYEARQLNTAEGREHGG